MYSEKDLETSGPIAGAIGFGVILGLAFVALIVYVF